MGHDTASRRVSDTALDAADDFKLALDIGRDGLPGEEGLAGCVSVAI